MVLISQEYTKAFDFENPFNNGYTFFYTFTVCHQLMKVRVMSQTTKRFPFFFIIESVNVSAAHQARLRGLMSEGCKIIEYVRKGINHDKIFFFCK